MTGEKKRPRKKLLVPLMLWDTAWKLLAIRRAIQRREYGWIAGIAVANSGGLLPMYYLWRSRESKPAQVAED